MFCERSLKRVEGSIRERKAEAQGNEVSGLFLAFLCTCGTKWVLRCCGLSTDLRVGSYSDPSTAVTAHPRSAKYRALRPAPQARSNTVPGVSFSAISTTSMVAASSLPWSPDRYLSSQPAISIAQSCHSVTPRGVVIEARAYCKQNKRQAVETAVRGCLKNPRDLMAFLSGNRKSRRKNQNQKVGSPSRIVVLANAHTFTVFTRQKRPVNV
jgi:hypothetical protein